MTDWNVHLQDIIQYAFDEVMPVKVTALGSKFLWMTTRKTPDTMVATYQYPKFITTYESRTAAPSPMWGEGYGTAFIGTKATLVVNRGGYQIIPAEKVRTVYVDKDPAKREMNEKHWRNFLDCIKTRQKTDRRNRNHRPARHHLHPVEPGDALQPAVSSGRHRQDGETEGRAQAARISLPRAVGSWRSR